MRSIFICAGRRDRAAANIVAAELDKLGIPCWAETWDRGDAELTREIRTSIGQCAAVVPIVSKDTAGAEWLDRHVDLALVQGKLIYPLKVGNCAFRGKLRFIHYEWFNARPSNRWFQRLHAICADGAILPQSILRKHERGVWSMAYDQRTRTLATGSWDGKVRFWTGNYAQDNRAETEQDSRFVLPIGQRVLALAYSPDGTELAIGCQDGTIHFWAPNERRFLPPLREHTGGVRSMAYTDDGHTLFSASTDGTGRVWRRPSDSSEPARVVNHDEKDVKNVLGIACGPDNRTFATASEDATIRIWDNPPHQEPRRVLRHEQTVWGVAYSPSGEYLASVSRDRTARVWDPRTGAEVRRLEGHTSSIISVAFSADGRFLATSGADETARLWEVATGELVAVLEGHSDAVRLVAFAPDRRQLTTGSADGTVMHWPLPEKMLPAGSHS